MANGAKGFVIRITGGACSVAILLAFIACAATPQQQSRIDSGLIDFDRVQISSARSDPTALSMASKMGDRYLAVFSPYQTSVAIAHLDDHDVTLLFRAVNIAFFYSLSARSLR